MSLTDTQNTIEAVATSVGPAVVGLGRGARRGSGVLIGDNRAITLARNLRGDEVTLTLAGDRETKARLLGVDCEIDLAVLELDGNGADGFEPPSWGSDDELPIGTTVLALADPGGRGLRVTAGHVSSGARRMRGPRGRPLEGLIEHTAPLPRGSGGGPLVDAEGRLLGLNAVRLDGGLILALPAALLRRRIDAVASGRDSASPRLGVAIVPPRAARRLRGAVGLPDRDGLLVRAVETGSPADRAGIGRGDLIVSVNGGAAASIDDLYAALDAAGDEGSLELLVVRGTEEHQVRVDLAPAATESA